MTDLEKLHSIDERTTKVLRRLTNATARLILEIRTHHRHNEKLEPFIHHVAVLEAQAEILEMLACLHQQPSQLHLVSKPSVARPSGSGKEKSSS